MNLKGQKVYIVHTFNDSGDALSYQLFADQDDAQVAVSKVNQHTDKTSEYAYWEHTTVR